MPGKASIGDYVWNDLNRNGLQEEGEPGPANVRMQLYARNASGGLTPLGDTFTEGNGLYRFFNLTPANNIGCGCIDLTALCSLRRMQAATTLSIRTWVLPVPAATTVVLVCDPERRRTEDRPGRGLLHTVKAHPLLYLHRHSRLNTTTS